MDKVLESVAALYSSGFEKHGYDAKSVGWGSKEKQWLRFEKLCYGFPCLPVSVNDLGCGYGALFDYMDQEQSLALSGYTGYDLSEVMLDGARCQFQDSRVTWKQQAHIDQAADYSIASGIFNVRFEADSKEWEEHVRSTLHNLAEYSIQGFAFNMLSTYVDYQESHLYYGDPTYYFDYCKRNFSKKVSLLHDYDLWEWTLCVSN